MYEDPVYINTIDCSFLLKKARFFLGDRWIDIGPIKLRNNQYMTEMDMPDIETFIARRIDLNDGTEDWLEWGPRLN